MHQVLVQLDWGADDEDILGSYIKSENGIIETRWQTNIHPFYSGVISQVENIIEDKAVTSNSKPLKERAWCCYNVVDPAD